MKAITFDKSFAKKKKKKKKKYFREPHRESFANGFNNIYKAVLYKTPYTGFSINSHIQIQQYIITKNIIFPISNIYLFFQLSILKHHIIIQKNNIIIIHLNYIKIKKKIN